MKILHTADWHLGKKLEGVSRLNEQAQALNELEKVVISEKVDVVVIAGDVFDTAIPSAEAEQLFFGSIARLSRYSFILAVAGNHDDPLRLCAPDSIASALNICLVGDMSARVLRGEEFSSGDGFVKFERGGERAVFGVLPYPSFSRLSQGGKEVDYNDYTRSVQAAADTCAAAFEQGAVNVFVSHLFMTGSDKGDERELGTAVILPKSVLPLCDYVALGHVHKPQTVSKSKNAYYSGSLLAYSFDDKTEKSFIIYDSGDKSVRRIKIEAGKKLLTFKTAKLSDALAFLDENSEAYVHIMFEGEPLALSAIKDLKSRPSFLKLTPIVKTRESAGAGYELPPLSRLFEEFWTEQTGAKPDDRLTDLFLQAASEETI